MTAHHERGPSKLPALAKCPSYRSALGEEGNANTGRGTALHDALRTGTIPDGDDADCIRWGLTELSKYGAIAPEVRLEFRLPGKDALDPCDTFGTADYVGDHLIIEIKTGQRRDYWPQLTCYAAAACQEYGWEDCRCVILFLDRRFCEDRVLLRSAAERFMSDLFARIDKGGEHPCDYCEWCARAGECQAIEEQHRLGILAAVGGENGEILKRFQSPGSCAIDRLEAPESLAAALEVARLIEAWAEAVRKRARAQMQGGAKIPGYELRSRAGATKIVSIEAAIERSGLPIRRALTACEINPKRLRELYAEDHAGEIDFETGKPKTAKALGWELDEKLGNAMIVEPSYKYLCKSRGGGNE